jgi:hypothetical protein
MALKTIENNVFFSTEKSEPVPQILAIGSTSTYYES